MKKMLFKVLVCVILTGITTNAVYAQKALHTSLVVKDGENIVKITRDFGENWEVYPTSTQNENWEWYTPEEFEHVIVLARDPTKAEWFTWHPEYGPYDYISESIMYSAEREMAILQQTLKDIKKGIKVSKPVRICITSDGLSPALGLFYSTNWVGWAHWYVYGYTFTDKAGKEVDLGIYETRTGLFNALKFYCDKEVRAGRMTKREANRMYRGLAHNVRNCDEVPLSDKLFNYKKLYDPYLYKPRN